LADAGRIGVFVERHDAHDLTVLDDHVVHTPVSRSQHGFLVKHAVLRRLCGLSQIANPSGGEHDCLRRAGRVWPLTRYAVV
jgi:hypothetical protein